MALAVVSMAFCDIREVDEMRFWISLKLPNSLSLFLSPDALCLVHESVCNMSFPIVYLRQNSSSFRYRCT